MKKIISSCLLGILLVSSTLASAAHAETRTQRDYRLHHRQVVIHHPVRHNIRARQVRHNIRARQVRHEMHRNIHHEMHH
jgi:hypothetical protein